MFAMKTTLDIPDTLYREFKAKTATNGEKMRNAVIAFIVAYNAGEWPRTATRERSARAGRRARASWKPAVDRFLPWCGTPRHSTPSAPSASSGKWRAP